MTEEKDSERPEDERKPWLSVVTMLKQSGDPIALGRAHASSLLQVFGKREANDYAYECFQTDDSTMAQSRIAVSAQKYRAYKNHSRPSRQQISTLFPFKMT